MARRSGLSLTKLAGEAARYARFYFDPAERTRMAAESGAAADGDYAVLLTNTFVPIASVPECVGMLRRFTRGGEDNLDAAGRRAMDLYLRELGAAEAELTAAFVAGVSTAAIQSAARASRAWPAIDVAASEEEMRTILIGQFEVLRGADVVWAGVDSSTYSTPKPDGLYTYVQWFWHGA